MKRSNRKGFTIVELVIVIAVVAILAAVLIPTFSGMMNKANQSADVQTVTTINTILAAENVPDVETFAYPSEMLAVVAENGYNVDKLDAKSDYEMFWNQVTNQIVLIDKDGKSVIGELDETASKNWQFVSSKDEIDSTKGYSVYLNDGISGKVTVTAGADAGNNTNVNIEYISSVEETVVFNTNGGKLTVNNEKADVNHYGIADEVVITAVKGASYHLYADVAKVEITKGNLVVKKGAQVEVIAVKSAAAKASAEGGAKVATVVAVVGATTSFASANVKEVASAGDIANAVTQATTFAGGTGSKANPYIIETVEQFKKIGDYSNSSFKVASSLKSIDCTDIAGINLSGSFNGNGVQFVNVSNTIFNYVGYNNESADITLKNFSADIKGAPALIKYIRNSGTTTFENIVITGYLEGDNNLGSFFRYGTAGADYTVKFVNCKSSADIIVYSGSVGGFVGHSFSGAGFTAYFEIDDDCAYTGTVYSANANQGDEFFGIRSTPDVITKNGEVYPDKPATRAAYTTVAPTLSEDGYEVAVQANVSKIAVKFMTQVTAYDENGEIIPNYNGITGCYNYAEIDATAGETVKVFDLITSSEIVNGSYSGGYSLTIDENGVLTFHTNSSANYLTGTIKLQIVQYDFSGKVIALGQIQVADIK